MDFLEESSLEEFNMANLKLAFHFAFERYQIYVKKEKLKLAPPWTKDKILQTYRFCNLHRENDNVSRTIFKYLNQSKTKEQLVFNAINFRRLNHNWTIASLGLLNPKGYLPSEYVKRCEFGLRRQLVSEGSAKFNDGAYVIPPPAGTELCLLVEMMARAFEDGTFSAKALGEIKLRVTEKTFSNPKNHGTLNRMKQKGFVEVTKRFTNFKIFLFALQNQLIIDRLEKICSANPTFGLYSEIRKLNGIGPFLAGQICVDIGYVNRAIFDEEELAPAGPGCMKGLGLLYHMDVPPNPNEKIEQILLKNIRRKQDNIWKALKYKAPPFGRMSLMTIENLMCEASKYISLHRPGQKIPRGRQKYRKRKGIEDVCRELNRRGGAANERKKAKHKK